MLSGELALVVAYVHRKDHRLALVELHANTATDLDKLVVLHQVHDRMRAASWN